MSSEIPAAIGCFHTQDAEEAFVVESCYRMLDELNSGDSALAAARRVVEELIRKIVPGTEEGRWLNAAS
jgi:hypothetical protein